MQFYANVCPSLKLSRARLVFNIVAYATIEVLRHIHGIFCRIYSDAVFAVIRKPYIKFTAQFVQISPIVGVVIERIAAFSGQFIISNRAVNPIQSATGKVARLFFYTFDCGRIIVSKPSDCKFVKRSQFAYCGVGFFFFAKH